LDYFLCSFKHIFACQDKGYNFFQFIVRLWRVLLHFYVKRLRCCRQAIIVKICGLRPCTAFGGNYSHFCENKAIKKNYNSWLLETATSAICAGNNQKIIKKVYLKSAL